MPEILLSTERLTKRFGGVIANDAIDLEVRRGELHAIIGPNGAGKTTLIAQLAGQLRPDKGIIRFAAKTLRVCLLMCAPAMGSAARFRSPTSCTNSARSTMLPSRCRR